MGSSKGLVFWLPALATLGCQGLGIGLVGIFGFFIEPLSTEFNVSVSSINIAPVFLMLVPGLIGPMIGKFADQFAIKNIMLCGVLLAMGSLYGIAMAENIYYACLGFLGFSIGLSLYGPITVNALLIKIYKSKAGRALAIAAMGASIATTLLPFAVAWLISNFDWRYTLMVLSFSITVFLGSVIIKILPGRCVDSKLASDGQPSTTADFSIENPTAVNPVSTSTVTEALVVEKPVSYLKDRAFWQIGIAVALAFNAALVMGISYPQHFGNMGFGLSEAAFLVSMVGLSGLIGKAFIATIVDKFRAHVRFVAATLICFQLLGAMLLFFVSDYSLMILVVAALGFGGGAFIPIHPYLNSAYFSADIIGQINGAQMPIFLPFGLVGAPLAGYSFDLTGSYLPAFSGVVVVLIIAVLLLVSLPKVHEPPLAN